MIRVKLQYEMNIFRNNFLKIPLIEDCNIVNEESSNKMICTIQVKENKNIKFIVYYLRNGYPKEIEELLSKIVMDDLYSVIFAPYISDNSARIIKNNDLGYMDFSGNCYFNRNLIHIHISGQKNEFVEKRKQKSIFERSSIVSSKILRTMLENPNKKWKLKELSNCVGCSIGQVSKVKEFLLNQSWIEQSSDGIRICKVAEVLKAWAVVYGKNNTMNYEYYTLENIANVEACLQQLKNEEGIEYFLTGFSGGVRYQPVVRYNKIHCYVNYQEKI